MAPPRVFVSSVVEGFQTLREAARQGIVDAGAQPVLVNEDFPALPVSPRNACLDGVASADVYLCIVGPRGGAKAPSGKLVTEEEYEHAKTLNRPTLVFVVEGPRDADADGLLSRLSRYVDGRFRVTVSTPEELRHEVAKAVRPLIRSLAQPMTDTQVVVDAIMGPAPRWQETMLRMVVAPERDEEVVDPLLFDDPAFLKLIYRIAHDPTVELMDYGFAKQPRIEHNGLVVEQDGASGPRDATQNVLVRISSSGLVIIDQNVSGRVRARSGGDLLDTMVVPTESIEAAAKNAFAFYRDFLQAQDPYQRQQGFIYNAALWGLGHRTISSSPQRRTSYPMRLSGGNSPLLAFDRPRGISRAQLTDTSAETGRIATLLQRQASTG